MKRSFFFLTLNLFFFAFSVSSLDAATLSFSPGTGTYNVGDVVTVSVLVSSADQSVNAASGVISFPRDKFEIVSFSKSGSIMNFWVQEPSYSNVLGTLNFEGVVLNPGFTGAGGKIISFNLRVKNEGGGSLSFSSGSVLANDGQGTNILNSSGRASFTLNPRQSETRPTVPLPKVTPVEPSSTSLPLEELDKIDAPHVTNFPTVVRKGEPIVIRGTTYPQSKVTIWFQHGGETASQTVTSNDEGEFAYVSDRERNEGVYRYWTTVTLESGRRSDVSEEFVIAVKPTLLQGSASWLMKALLVITPIALLLIALAFIALYSWYKFRALHIRLKKEIKNAEKTLHKTFSVLKDEAGTSKMKNELSAAERFVEKEMEDIGKKL